MGARSGERSESIVVAALFESGVESKLAVPIVKDVIKAFYDKKARLGLKNTPGVPRTARPPEASPPLTAPAPKLTGD